MSTPTRYADLELSLLLHGPHAPNSPEYQCRVELRFRRPDSDIDPELLARNQTVLATFKPADLPETLEDSAYGRRLGEMLFANADLLTAYARAKTLTLGTPNVHLRLRLYIDPAALALHTLSWERLIVPGESTFLSKDEHVLLSRYLTSDDAVSFVPPTLAAASALLVVADPSDAEEKGLSRVNLEHELHYAHDALDPATVTIIKPGGATLENIGRHLRDGYDILFLVCHGLLIDGQPFLCLEDETPGKEGLIDPVPGADFAQLLSELPQRPTLVLLASCQSAAQSVDAAATSAVGPQLVSLGIPAVIAMRGTVGIETAGLFARTFFTELRRDGLIDRATAAARGTLERRERRTEGSTDWSTPVLYMRLRGGQLFDVPRLAAVEPSPVPAQLYPLLSQLDFSRQQDAFKQFRRQSKTGAILLSGQDAMSGQLWLLRRLYQLSFRDKKNLLVVKFDLAANRHVAITAEVIWQQIALQVELDPLASVDEVIDALYAVWASSHIALICLNVSDYLEELLGDVWQELAQAFADRPQPEQSCFMFLTNEKEPLPAVRTVETAQCPVSDQWLPQVPVRLPELPNRFDEDDLYDWLDDNSAQLPIQDSTLQGKSEELLTLILAEGYDGKPLPTLQAIYQVCVPRNGLYWSQAYSNWIKEVR